jgi:hypothetical protein
MLPSIVDDSAWTVRVDDLRGCSFERFVTYAFDRPVPRTEKEPNWWHGEGVDEVELLIDGAAQLEHGCALFRDPLMLHDRFSPDQIEQGFWFLGMGSRIPSRATNAFAKRWCRRWGVSSPSNRGTARQQLCTV